MNDKRQTNDLFEAAHLSILISYTILSVSLVAESLLMGWEKWALILIVIFTALSWAAHIRGIFTKYTRLWMYSILMMVTFFFYGIHLTSTYDMGMIMVVVIMIYTMTGIKKLIILCEATYFLTMGYDLVAMITADTEWDDLLVSRTALHIVIVFMAGVIARVIIDKWNEVLDKSDKEITILEDATRRMNDFLANVSHEVRTPINAVIGLTGVCVEKEKDEDIRSDMLAVESAGKRVANQISDILDYTEVDMNNLAVNKEDYMMSSVLNDLVVQLRPNKPRELELVIDVAPEIPSVMNTDVGKLKKILWHLISNGLKYTREGGVYAKIYPIQEPYGINLCIDVRDTGVGMSPEELERVTEGFYQANSGRTRSSNGLGLGMSIVAGFVSALKGFMTIESDVETGTRVHVSIPQQVVDPARCMSVSTREDLVIGAFLHFEKFPNAQVREYYNSLIFNIVSGLHVQMHRVENIENLKKLMGSAHLTHLFVGVEEYESDMDYMDELSKEVLICIVAEEDFIPRFGSHVRVMVKPFYCFPVINILNSSVNRAEDAEERITCPGAKALVVDDEPMNHTVAKGILGRYGMEVYIANSGPEAIEMCKNNHYDIVFMDHMMPGMDGVETMKRIRVEAAAKDLPIIALTANAVSTAREMFVREGFNGFVSKPIELPELERVMRNVLPASLVKVEHIDVYPGGIIDMRDSYRSGMISGQYTGVSGDAAPVGRRTDLAQETGTVDAKQGIYPGRSETLGLDTSIGLKYCQNDEDFYKTLLGQYALEEPAKSAEAEQYYKNNNLADYAVVIHALKSTSKMIGALELSDRAKALEDAAKAGDIDSVRAKHILVMEEYKVLASRIRSYLGGDDASDDDEVMEFTPQENS